MFDDSIKEKIQELLGDLPNEVNLVYFTQEFECRSCKETRQFLEEFTSLHDNIKLHVFEFVNDKSEAEKYGVDNPNLELINELTEAGADIIICGQTASFRGITKDNANPNVKFALSAMTALIQYQKNGYTFIKF